MIRKALKTATLAGVLGAFAAAGGASQTAQAKTLVYAVYIPATHVLVKRSIEPFLQKVTEATGGSLEFDFYPGGAMITGKTSLDGIGGGVVDGGQIVDAYTPSELPHTMVVSDLALLGSDSRAAAAAVAETVLLDCERCKQDFLDANVVPLGVNATAPYHLICTQPANTLEKVEGLRLRTPGAWGPWANALGATPVNISSAEAYEALERGQLDCTFGSTAWLESYSLWDVAKHVVEHPMGVFQGSWILTMNKDTWAGLSKEHKQAVIDNLAFGMRGGVEGYLDDAKRVKQEALERGDITFHEPSEGFKQRLAEHRENELERVAEIARGRGVENPEEIIQMFQENLNKWEKRVAEMEDFDAYQAALDEHIVSKLPLEY